MNEPEKMDSYRSQDKKRNTLFSYFSSGTATPTPTPSDATPAPTPSDTTPTHIHSVATPTHTPSATPTATSNGTATPSDTSEFDLASLERDPGLRRPIWKYPPNVRDDIRREYIRLGPCQPQLRRDQYPDTEFGTQRRRFQASWFNTFKWLEYSVLKDAAFCFPCYLKVMHLHNMLLLLMDLRVGKELMMYLTLQLIFS
ncbi:hypothetical protein POM88_036613 [Heracleum sosnowskyi]|uniref:TTF-type domain-containing protein n=1 Tax=Heracleum sosnowskyi TaxID=360622 RepID=A0AAD8HNR3_9APIA|nr:hypothetical protein POM88_036613 [Heracleum sosnowskyi]